MDQRRNLTTAQETQGSPLEATGAHAIWELKKRRVTHREARGVRSQYVHADKHCNRQFETTSSGCVTSNPAISRGTTIYPLISALAPPTPTISGAKFSNELIVGRVGRWS